MIQFYDSEFGGPRPSLWRRIYSWFMWTFYPDEMKNETRWFLRALERLYWHGGARVDEEFLATKRTIGRF